VLLTALIQAMNVRLGPPSPDVTLPTCLMPLQITTLSGVCTNVLAVSSSRLYISLVFFPNPDILYRGTIYLLKIVAQERLVAFSGLICYDAS
jgi:hypothetical protein